MDKYHPVALHFSAISFYQRRVSWKQKLSLAEDWVSNGVHGMFGICFWHEQVRWGIKNKKNKKQKTEKMMNRLWALIWTCTRETDTHTRNLFSFSFLLRCDWRLFDMEITPSECIPFFFLSPCFSFTYFKCCALRKKKNMLLLTTW